MNWGIGLIFIGVIGCVLLVWYLCRCSEDETAESEEVPADDAYEDLLLTGLMLKEVYEDQDHESSDDMDADSYDDGFGGGYDDGGTFQ